MKEIKMLMYMSIILFSISSCNQEEQLILPEAEVAQIETRAPGPDYISSEDICANGSQVNLKFIDCEYSPVFYINVFKPSGGHVDSFRADNANLDSDFFLLVGSPTNTNDCSPLDEGGIYPFSITPFPNTNFAWTTDKFIVSSATCNCQ